MPHEVRRFTPIISYTTFQVKQLETGHFIRYVFLITGPQKQQASQPNSSNSKHVGI